MTTQSATEALGAWVREVLASGLRIDASVQRYLEATHGSSDLATVLAGRADSQTDSLLELLFFPDFTLQTDYEMRWGQSVFSAAQQEAVVALLQKAPPLVVVHGLPHAPPVSINAPAFALETFVRRLNITWQPHPRLAEILEKQLAPAQQIAVRVQMRNAPLAWHGNQVDLLALFLVKMPFAERTFTQDLVFLLALLGELGPKQQPAEFLIAKKHFYFQALCKAEAFESHRQASNMETLILQGARAACGDTAQWRKQMQHIDRICRVLFGRTPFFHPPTVQSMTSTIGMADQELSDLMNMLS